MGGAPHELRSHIRHLKQRPLRGPPNALPPSPPEFGCTLDSATSILGHEGEQQKTSRLSKPSSRKHRALRTQACFRQAVVWKLSQRSSINQNRAWWLSLGMLLDAGGKELVAFVPRPLQHLPPQNHPHSMLLHLKTGARNAVILLHWYYVIKYLQIRTRSCICI